MTEARVNELQDSLLDALKELSEDAGFVNVDRERLAVLELCVAARCLAEIEESFKKWLRR